MQKLKLGEYIEYTTTIDENRELKTNDAKWVCIQVPSDYESQIGTENKTVYLDVGDINFDGKIDNEDYIILAQYTATGPNADKLPYNKANWTPTDKQLLVMNCKQDNEYNINNINVDDAVYLYNYINDIGSVIDLGVAPYTIQVNAENYKTKNVGNLLIIDGHYDKTVNIPFNEFVTDGCAIHDKFFNYLFGMAIHKYSNTENITYLQKLLKEAFPEYSDDIVTFQTGVYTKKMRELLKKYQLQQVLCDKGDLNNDNKLTNADLVLMQNYITDSADYTKVYKYIEDPIENPLTPEEIEALDRDGDGKITAHDLMLIDAELSAVYSATLRTRADIDGNMYVDDFDYYLLDQVIQNGSVTYEDERGRTITTDLKKYKIPFQLGWLDVQTEKFLEFGVNDMGDISEVSK